MRRSLYIATTQRPIAAAAAAFSPNDLGTLIVHFDIQDLGSLWQSTGTGAVTTVNDPVYRINDKGGSGNHANVISGNTAKRPLLKQTGGGKYYLQGDATDDEMTFPYASAVPTAITIVAGVTGTHEATRQIWQLGTDADGGDLYSYVDGTIRIGAGSTARKIFNRGTTDLVTPHVLFIESKAGSYIVERNNTQIHSTATNTVGFPGTGRSPDSGYLFAFAGTWPAPVNLSSLVIVPRVLTSGEKTSLKAWATERL